MCIRRETQASTFLTRKPLLILVWPAPTMNESAYTKPCQEIALVFVRRRGWGGIIHFLQVCLGIGRVNLLSLPNDIKGFIA